MNYKGSPLHLRINKSIKIIFILVLIINFNLVGQNQWADHVITLKDSLPQAVGGIAVDKLGFVYAADFEEKVWQINPYTKEARVFADGFYGASGNGFDSNGRLYQANFYGNYISRINRYGESEVFADSLLKGPVGITVNKKDELFVCNCAAKSIIKVSTKGETSEFASSNHLHCPNGITIDKNENLYVVSYNNNKIIKINPKGEASIFARTPDKIGNGHITFVNNTLFVTGFHGHRIYQVNMNGAAKVIAGTGERGVNDGSALSASFSYPNGIAASPNGKVLYINDMHGVYNSPNLTPCKSSIRTIKLNRISDHIKKEIESNGIAHALKLYKKLKKEEIFAQTDSKIEINTLGHNYMMVGEHKKAEAVFKMNIDSYPDFALTYVYMARNMYLLNKTSEARNYYKKALELMPGNAVIELRLKDLEEVH